MSAEPSPLTHIRVRGARVHNLRDVDVCIPRDRLVVITGLSGSGKSSLAFDTIYAEGQRRYVESLSAYARQFLEQLAKPDVDSIDGLSPAIAIEQRSIGNNPRSTVGTATEIYDYLRLLFARVGKPHCHRCGKPIASQTVQQIAERVIALGEGARVQILAPVVRGRKGEYRKELAEWSKQGFARARIDGELRELGAPIALDRRARHDIAVVVDRIAAKASARARISDSIETALRLAGGLVAVDVGLGEPEWLLSERSACVDCGVSYPAIEPRSFSFNSAHGACPACGGLGYRAAHANRGRASEAERAEAASETQSAPCADCSGTRLRIESRSVLVGRASIAEVAQRSVADAAVFFEQLTFAPADAVVAEKICTEINDRLRFLGDVGLGYLTLDRRSATLSGGESQRIRLATQVGSRLMGVLYVLDEPSIGLHPRDNQRLIETLERLRDAGNSVLVVEHDEATIRAADFAIDMGPGAGIHGGRVVAAGTPAQIAASADSPTGAYLARTRRIPVPERRRTPAERLLVLEGCRGHNLKRLDVTIPLGLFTAVTGVSGSGKSTLINDTLYRTLAARLHRAEAPAQPFDRILGVEHLDKVVDVSQAPIGRTPRSNPATYTGALTTIRELFSRVPEARVRGYSPARFSFNLKGGRCEACEGDGTLRVEMHFLPDLFVTCEQCAGRRYNRETLEIRYKARSIADVLEMSVEEALAFAENVPALRRPLQTLFEVGLGYLQLGQPATTLSGGEAQRIKLARELSRVDTGRTLYLLDEPTTGLHFADVEQLLRVLDRLVEKGNTVVVVEHHPDVVKCADFVIDLGPGAGVEGGELVVAGTPEQVATHPRSHTGRALREVL
ncbi:MAG TPA: excinuclease ABC subunit UvrA [Myxococcota bacterium]|nr:excinuclease ABC subunit UvrA [Myxococcota bacterium]